MFLTACGTTETDSSNILEESTSVEVTLAESAENTSVEETITTEETTTEESTVEETDIVEESIEEVSEFSDMEVHFIDVGQGDATLIKADDHYMLIDAGDNSKGTTVQNYLQKQGVEKLDYLILTHTDADHIGGADVIVSKFDIDTAFLGDYKKDNKTYEELMNAFDYKGLNYVTPSVGSEYQLGNATFTIVAPNRTYSDPNNSGIALVLKNGENTFLFTGDCEEDAESDILSNGQYIDCDVYKLGHHGSKASSTKSFLDAVTPIYGVISCEEGNSYGHPHTEPLNNLRAMGVKIFRTDEQGSIIAYSNGTEITWNTAPSETLQVGESTESTKVSELQSESVVETPNSKPVDEEIIQEPVVEEPPAPEPAQSVGTCWKSETGSKYHSINNCGRMNPDRATQITIEQAENLGLGRCNKCW